jgi:hypothetical protein
MRYQFAQDAKTLWSKFDREEAYARYIRPEATQTIDQMRSKRIGSYKHNRNHPWSAIAMSALCQKQTSDRIANIG